MYLGYSKPVPIPVPALPRRPSRDGFVGPLAKLAEAARLIALWRRRARTRAELRRLCELDARTLNDIGLGADEVRREMSRPFWK